jgi:CheY-like chemotaxis protein
MGKALDALAPAEAPTTSVVRVADWWFFSRRDDDRLNAARDDAPSPGQLDARRNARKHRVLVVDDDADVRTMLRTQLEIEGYSVLEAADGDQAWETIQREDPPVVIADVQMPGRNGLELCRLARASGFETTGFIAFTAGMASWDECRDAGFDAHFLKTDPLPSLSRTVRRLSR